MFTPPSVIIYFGLRIILWLYTTDFNYIQKISKNNQKKFSGQISIYFLFHILHYEESKNSFGGDVKMVFENTECCPNPCGVAIVVVIVLLLIAMSVLA
jgi:hypothetical protein